MEPQPSPGQWEEFNTKLQTLMEPTKWQTWIQPLTHKVDDGTIRFEAPTSFHGRWVQDRYLAAMQEVAVDIFGNDIAVVLDTPAEPVAFVEEPDPVPVTSTEPETPQQLFPTDPMSERAHGARLVPKYTFENFVVGQSNRFAHAAAMAVAEQPGRYYNPLFIYGGAGLGKTHLLHAVGHHAQELQPGLNVRYVSSERFFNEFINGIRRKRMDEFKSRYRNNDVLLLDDVQFFEGKEQILEEFFHTFNTLYEASKQLVISSDRHPKNLSTLEDRLRSRFEWGLLTDIQPPDVETRLAILRRNAEFAPMAVTREVLEFIAVHVLDNIRELEGALTRVTAYAGLTNQQVTIEIAQDVLADIVPAAQSRPLTSEDILDATANMLGVSRPDLLGPSRRQPLARYRQIGMYLCRELTDLSLPKIGAVFGGRDHTTVIHAIDKIKSLMQSDRDVYNVVTELSQKLRTT
ncbi:MAG: chromosomal replication initiator protein DnaA [Acidimicrobiia bacterium]|nr:chromosomal replication initiator protein DnaA [Acidimicrobiia bacterium]